MFLDERRKTTDDRVILDESPKKGDVRLSSWKHVVSIGFIALVLALFFTACSDYEDMYQDAYGYLLDEAKIDYGYFVDDRDNQSYKTIKIGTQTWMAENLNYEYKVNKKIFGNVENSKHPEYGRYYTWAAAMDSAAVFTADGKGCGYAKSCSPSTEAQGVCPEGWHLPTKDEFASLWRAVGGQSTAGINLKFRKGWENDGDGINRYGFSALPAGGYYKQTFLNVGENAAFWSATAFDNKEAYFMDLHSSSDDANWNNHTKEEAYSVRCLKNVQSFSKKSSSSSVVKSSSSVAKLSSSVMKSSSSTSKSSSSVTKLSSSIVKSSSSNKVSSSSTKAVTSSAVVKSSSSVAKSSSSQAKLSSSVAKSSSSVVKSSSSSKATWAYLNPKISYGEVVDDRDKQVYKTVKIGNQTWMAENLNYKTENSYCYGNADSNCVKYGRLYTWTVAKNSCLSDWHLPTKEEWSSLIVTVGDANKGGRTLKSVNDWYGNGNGTDIYGFSALPAGMGKSSINMTKYAYFWSSSEYNDNGDRSRAFSLSLDYNSDYVGLVTANKSDAALSVRCIKD
jgi:uncharacterized protein (TIGR02145 family)